MFYSSWYTKMKIIIKKKTFHTSLSKKKRMYMLVTSERKKYIDKLNGGYDQIILLYIYIYIYK